GLRAMTFHAYCYGVLERAGKAFRLLTPEDLWVYLRQRISDLGLSWYIRAASPGQFLDALLELFDRCHDEVVGPADYRKYAAGLGRADAALPRVVSSKQAEGMSRDEVLARCNEIASAFQKVEEMLACENLGAFAHMITRALELLRNDEQLRAAEQGRVRFLLLDEFQDVNLAQIELAQLLAGSEQNLFAVGDPDQAIYRFRGASSAAFREFARRFPKTRRVTLIENQRSRTPILKCAYAVISGNPAMAPAGADRALGREPLESARDQRDKQQGELLPKFPVEIVSAESDEQEAFDIACRIEELRRAPGKRRDGAKERRCPRIAVLYRQHSHRNLLVRELVARHIPFVVVGLNALETPEVRDLLACLRVLASMADSGSLFRVAALPIFHVDAEALRQSLKHAGKDADFISVLEGVPGGSEVVAAVEEAWAMARMKGMNTAAVLMFVLERFAFDRNAPPVLAFAKFVLDWTKKPVAGNGELSHFLAYMDHYPEAGGIVAVPTDDEGSDPNVVQLMTAHAAKGLEFDHVFMLRANQNSFPTSFREKLFEFPQQLRRGLVAEGDDKEIHKQEERRLFYVGMTRARETLTLCSRPGRARVPRPTGFVRDLMDDRNARPYWSKRDAAPFTIDLAAGAAAAGPGVGAWLLNPPPSPFVFDGALSATAIESYETCPLQFKIERFWKVPGEVAAQMQYGNAIHTLLRDYYESLRAGRPKSEGEVLALLRDGLASAGFADPVQRELYEKEGTKQLREFVRLQQAAPPVEVIGTERGFEITLAGVRVKGRLDRIDRIAGNRVAIVDYKTGKPRTPQHADKSLQLSIYALAARAKWDYDAERLVFYNLADNTEVASERDPRQLEEACQRVAGVAAQIAAGNFDPKPGFHCGWCAYRSLCPATEERLYQIQMQAAGVN
ncbi:MAG TPA: ATP-dependent DNA helicase, partial [Terriglobales bacterium]|nr:ATP-dependent DNA helicase [Terriglobales bacterium]